MPSALGEMTCAKPQVPSFLPVRAEYFAQTCFLGNLIRPYRAPKRRPLLGVHPIGAGEGDPVEVSLQSDA